MSPRLHSGARSAGPDRLRLCLALAMAAALLFTLAGARAQAPETLQLAVDRRDVNNTLIAWTPIERADSYNLYRSLRADGSDRILIGSGLRQLNGDGVGFHDRTAATYTSYYYQIQPVYRGRQGVLSAAARGSLGLHAPAAPAALSARAIGAQRIRLAWPPSANATFYAVFRALRGRPFALYRTGITTPFFEDAAVVRGSLYTYAVAAGNEVGMGARTEPASAVPVFRTLPAPAQPTATVSGNAVQLRWSAVPGAVRYNLYRSSTATSEGSLFLTTRNLGYDDPFQAGGPTHFYRIAAVGTAGEGLRTAPLKVTLPAIRPRWPGLVARAGSASVVLSWPAVPGAATYQLIRDGQPLRDGLTGTTFTDTGLTNGRLYNYRLHAVNSAGASDQGWEAPATPGSTPLPAPAHLWPHAAMWGAEGIATVYWAPVAGAGRYHVYRAATPDAPESLLVAVVEGWRREFTDRNLDPATTYYYRVAAGDQRGEGARSAATSVTPRVVPLPTPPIKARAGSGAVRLTWGAIGHAGSYNLYREPGPRYVSGITGTEFTDTEVTDGTGYRYWVAAANVHGSGFVHWTPTAVPGSTPLPAPEGLTATVEGPNQVLLTWTAVPGARWYHIYRSSTPGGQGEAPLAGSGHGFREGGLLAGTTYYYRVAAVNDEGEGEKAAEVRADTPRSTLAAPAALIARSGADRIELEWPAVPGATGYALYRAATGESERLYQPSLTTNRFTDTSVSTCTTYSYRVAAVNGAGIGPPSPWASAALPDYCIEPAPNPIVVAAGDSDAANIRITTTGDFNGLVKLSVAGAPTGVTAALYPEEATTAGSTLLLFVSTRVLPGDYPLTITGRSGTLVHTGQLVLRVGAAGSTVRKPARAAAPLQPAADPRTVSRGVPAPANGSLLDEVGRLAYSVPAAERRRWQEELTALEEVPSGSPQAQEKARLLVRLGELEIEQEQPARAEARFRQARALLPAADPVAGLADYDTGLALYFQGAYRQATDRFAQLVKNRSGRRGYRQRSAVWWALRAHGRAAYHEERERAGIPNPERLDPECGAASLAACLRELGRPWDKPTLKRVCRITGMGSSLQDLIDAGGKLGVSVRAVTADDQGLRALPKPVIAYVERDHFVAVKEADAQGVVFYCTCAGGWPGNEVRLTWSQWRLMEPGIYGVVTRPDSAAHRNVELALREGGRGKSDVSDGLLRVASSGPLAGLLGRRAAGMARQAQLLLGHIAVALPPPGGIICGDRPASAAPAPACGNPKDCGGPKSGNSGPSAGDPVNLATGEEEYRPEPDLEVYNPIGPSISWERIYSSLRSVIAPYYQRNDFGEGWSHSYNVGVQDPTGGRAAGEKFLVFENGARVSFNAPAVPAATQTRVRCAVAAGNPYLVEWAFDPTQPAGFYLVTFQDRTRWILRPVNLAKGIYSLARLEDRSGNGINFRYETRTTTGRWGREGWRLLSQIADDAGRPLLTFRRVADGSGSLVWVQDAYGRRVYYRVGLYPCRDVPPAWLDVYHQLDRVSQVVPAATLVPPDRYRYGYELVANGDLDEKLPFLATISVPSPTGAGVATARIDYDPTTDQVRSVTDANGNRRFYSSVDENGDYLFPSSFTQVTVENAAGQVVSSYRVGYDANTSETVRVLGDGDHAHRRQTLTYADPSNPFRPSEVTDGNNNVTRYTWDAFGNLLKETAPDGLVTTYTYDYSRFPLGELVKVQEAGKSPVTLTYHQPSGLVRTITTPLPGTRASTQTVTWTYSYDALGNIRTITGPGNNAAATVTTTYEYATDGSFTQTPAVDQPLKVTNSLGHADRFRYDAQGNLVTHLDAAGNRSDFTYDITNSPLTTLHPPTGTNPAARVITANTYLYPGGPLLKETLLSETGAKVREVGFTYGPEGELRSRTGSDEPVTLTYDGDYRVSAVADGAGRKTLFQYRTDGHLASITYPDGGSERFPSYDENGNPLSRIDGRGVQTRYVYNDRLSRLTEIQYPTPALNVRFTYDQHRRRATMADGTGTTTYRYDDEDRLTAVITQPAGLTAKTIAYTYYPDGSRQTMETPAGKFQYSYDRAGRLTSLLNPFGETSRWSYTSHDLIASQQLGNGIATAFAYDGRELLRSLASRKGATLLSQFAGSPGVGMAYDPAGNRTAMSVALPAAAALGGSVTYSHDLRNQLTSEQGTGGRAFSNRFAYDLAGNATTFRGITHTYNTANQIAGTGFQHDRAGNPTRYRGLALTFDPENRLTGYGTLLKAGYNGDGLRAWKQTAAGKTYFLYDGLQPVVELNGSGVVAATHTFGADGLLSRRVGSTSTFYTFDPQGSVVQRLSAAGAALTTSRFDAYGTGTTVGTAPADPFGYGAQWGYYTDVETGLQLLGHRYYDPQLGRFLTRDPIGHAGGVNLYGYVANSPLTGIDPDGLCKKPKKKEPRKKNGQGSKNKQGNSRPRNTFLEERRRMIEKARREIAQQKRAGRIEREAMEAEDLMSKRPRQPSKGPEEPGYLLDPDRPRYIYKDGKPVEVYLPYRESSLGRGQQGHGFYGP